MVINHQEPVVLCYTAEVDDPNGNAEGTLVTHQQGDRRLRVSSW